MDSQTQDQRVIQLLERCTTLVFGINAASKECSPLRLEILNGKQPGTVDYQRTHDNYYGALARKEQHLRDLRGFASDLKQLTSGNLQLAYQASIDSVLKTVEALFIDNPETSAGAEAGGDAAAPASESPKPRWSP